jgi:hexokinase
MKDFLAKNYLLDEFYALDTISADFLSEMEKGLIDEKTSSLLMLPSFALVDSDIKLNKKIAVIDAGGTNIRLGCVWFDENGKYNIEGFKKQAMLGTDWTLTKDEFFSNLAYLVLPYLDKTDLISISFAYPTTITKDMDGKIIKLVKELKITGVDGCLIGEELIKYLKKAGKENVKVMVTNDTTATAFAGKAQTINEDYNSHIGVIVGTGMNTCYPETFSSIPKLPEFLGEKRMMINVESGNFDKLLRSPVDKAYDKSTTDEGYHVLEKMVSGGYIGGLCDAYLKTASDNNLFSEKTVKNIKGLSLSSMDISDFLSSSDDSIIKDAADTCNDYDNIKLLLEKIVRRAANLAALQIYSLSLKCAKPGDKLCITVEGTTFYKLPKMQQQTEEFLNLYMPKANLSYKILEVNDAVMKGCAAIGLQQI